MSEEAKTPTRTQPSVQYVPTPYGKNAKAG